MDRNRWYVLVGVVLLVLAVVGLYYLYKSETGAAYQTTSVVRGTVTQEVLASGSVEAPTTVDLHVKNSGRLVALSASVGQRVAPGDVLAQQDTSVLDAQLAQAQAGVSAASAVLQSLKQGATPQAIAVSQSQLSVASQSLANAYASAPNTLADAYAKGNDAVVNQLALFFSNAQTSNPQFAFSTTDAQAASTIASQRVAAGSDLAILQQEVTALGASPSNAQVDTTLSNAAAHLSVVQSLLTAAVTLVAENTSLSNAAAASYRASASVGLSETNAALGEVRALVQQIASAQTQVAEAQSQLNLTTAGSTQDAIAAQQAVVAQAQANESAIAAQLRDAEIISPVAGVITNTSGSVGDVITPATAVVSLLPDATLEVKVNVSENNIVGVAVGETAHIELDAFPSGTTFTGVVSAIDPAQTIIGGAVYYQATILFDKNYSGIKPGMTANVRIKTGSHTDTLLVPASAVQHASASSTVQVLQDDSAVFRTVTTGLTGQDGMVEILSGLSVGDRVVIGNK